MHRKFLDVQTSCKFILRYFVTVIPGGYFVLICMYSSTVGGVMPGILLRFVVLFTCACYSRMSYC